MQGVLETAQAAFTLLLILFTGWLVVFAVATLVERKLRGKAAAPTLWSSFAWLWDNANVIGIPVLVLGTIYMIWAIYYGPGIGGPSLLVLLLMGAAGLLIGFAPALRGR